jgi:hypothetical protein
MALLHGRCPLNPMTDLQQAEAQSGLFDLGRPRQDHRGRIRLDNGGITKFGSIRQGPIASELPTRNWQVF